jgi:hypothetical protein
MKTTILSLILGAVTTQMEGCEKVRLFERMRDVYANWYDYPISTQNFLIIFTLGFGILMLLIGRYLT